jgi:hypothetical protein
MFREYHRIPVTVGLAANGGKCVHQHHKMARWRDIFSLPISRTTRSISGYPQPILSRII